MPVFSSPPPFLSVWVPSSQNGTTHFCGGGGGGVFLSLVTKSRKSSTLLSFSTSRGNHTLLPVCGYPWEMSRGFDTSNFLGSPSTQASPLQLHVMTSEGLLPAQRLYEETPRPHISRPLHLSEIMKEESTSSSPSLRSRLQSQ